MIEQELNYFQRLVGRVYKPKTVARGEVYTIIAVRAWTKELDHGWNEWDNIVLKLLGSDGLIRENYHTNKKSWNDFWQLIA